MYKQILKHMHLTDLNEIRLHTLAAKLQIIVAYSASPPSESKLLFSCNQQERLGWDPLQRYISDLNH